MARKRSFYITMRDAVRIAVDLSLPEMREGERIPAILRATRYWRNGPYAADDPVRFTDAGYAFVLADVRGTGASFGSWGWRSPDEVADLGEIVDWIVAQPWSNGRVGGTGVSYDGNAAVRLAAVDRPAVKAIVPRFTDFDAYAMICPGGIPVKFYIELWGHLNLAQDLNDPDATPGLGGEEREYLRSELAGGPRPVDEDVDGALLAQAIAEHGADRELYLGPGNMVYRDDRISETVPTVDRVGAFVLRDAIERSGTPMFHWASWLDSATAAGALSQFMTFSNPQRLIIGPWDHGAIGSGHLYQAAATPVEPDLDRQYAMMLEFLNARLKDGRVSPAAEHVVRYYTYGEETWHETSTWPPPGFRRERWYFAADGALSTAPSASPSGEDGYEVDFSASTGLLNRWNQFSSGASYPDRAEEDRKLQTYTSPPLDEDTEITGDGAVAVFLHSTEADFAVFAYLEDVWPDGRVTYLTEGQLRAMHRRPGAEPPPYAVFGPYHSFLRADSLPVRPGELLELRFAFHPTSVVVRRGHRLRVALAGADAATFARIPAEGTPHWSIERNATHASYVEVPARTAARA